MFASLPTLLLSACLLGDVIVLKNGNEIQGEILKEEDGRILVRFPGGTLELQEKQVERVRRQPRIEYLVEEAEKYELRGEHEDAVRTFVEATQEDPSSQRARKGLLGAREGHAAALSDVGRYEEARAAFDALLRSDPSNDRARKEIRIIDEILTEARKEEEKGREEIASGRLEQGIWRLQRIFERFPDRSKEVGLVLGEALITEGDGLLRKQDWKGAEARYLRALSTEPELLPRLKRQFAYSKARQIEPLVRAGDFASVEKLSQEGLDVDPTNEPLRYFHGLSLEGKGKPREAAEEYLALLDVKRPASLEKAAPELRVQAEAKLIQQGAASPTTNPRAREVLPGDFRELRTDHFTIFHKNNEVAREVAFVAERAYGSIFQDLDCATQLRSRIRINIYPSKDEYVAASGLQSWSGGAHLIAKKMGDLTEHRIYSFQDQPRLATGVLPHEIAHALFSHRLNYPDSVPLWANEGFAVLREPAHFHQYYRKVLIQEAARKTLLPLRVLIARQSYPEDRVDAFYGQSFSLTQFLVSLEGLPTFIHFVKAISVPNPAFDTSLRKYYGILGVDALENRWRSWFESGGN
jgi:tetratricopeptide (TPR) repeat protein